MDEFYILEYCTVKAKQTLPYKVLIIYLLKISHHAFDGNTISFFFYIKL